MKIKYFYLNKEVELCIIIGELPKTNQEQQRCKEAAIVIGNQNRAFQILYEQYTKDVKFDQFYKIAYPVIYSSQLNKIMN